MEKPRTKSCENSVEMIDPEFVLVDSNIIIDIITLDSTWAEWSGATLEQYPEVKVNPIIYAELCYQLASSDELDQLLATLGIGYSELSKEALFLASQAYRAYRQRGGNKTSPLPDFFIGAHAAVLGIPIISRDTNRYQTYFPTVELIRP